MEFFFQGVKVGGTFYPRRIFWKKYKNFTNCYVHGTSVVNTNRLNLFVLKNK